MKYRLIRVLPLVDEPPALVDHVAAEPVAHALAGLAMAVLGWQVALVWGLGGAITASYLLLGTPFKLLERRASERRFRAALFLAERLQRGFWTRYSAPYASHFLLWEALLRFRIGDVPAAKACLAQIKPAGKDAARLAACRMWIYAQIFDELGDDDSVLDVLDDVPDDALSAVERPIPHVARALVFLSRCDDAKFLEEYEKAVACATGEPETPWILYVSAMKAVALDRDAAKACELIVQAADLAPRHDVEEAEYAAALAMVMIEGGAPVADCRRQLDELANRSARSEGDRAARAYMRGRCAEIEGTVAEARRETAEALGLRCAPRLRRVIEELARRVGVALSD